MLLSGGRKEAGGEREKKKERLVLMARQRKVHTYVTVKIQCKVVWRDSQAILSAHLEDQLPPRFSVGVASRQLLGVI